MDDDLKDQQIIQEFKNLENLPPVSLILPANAIWLIICQLQLALRLPQNKGKIAEDTRDIAEQLQHGFDWSPLLKQSLEWGWNPEHDVDISKELRIETHAAFTVEQFSDTRRDVRFSRPRDWGNSQKWYYEFYRIERVIPCYEGRKTTIVTNCHCWTNCEVTEPGDYPFLFSDGILSDHTGDYLTPNGEPTRPPQLCGRDYLAPDDVWCEDWGSPPPIFNPPDELD